MKAIAITHSGDQGYNLDYLLDIDISVPVATGRDLLIEVKAVAVNPADVKIRAWHNTNMSRILGWDAVGIVKSVGENVTLFKPGDEVWYAGALTRPGCNSEYQLVDERIVAHKPTSVSRAAAAAMPLTSITAWELLFDRLGIVEGGNAGDTLLIVGAAGGVGSMLTQLARQLTKMTVIGTASRPESKEWVRKIGAHEVIDHSKPLDEELARIGINDVTHVASLTNTDEHYPEYLKIIAPQGKLGIVDDPEYIDAVPLKGKCISLHWEAMFVRSIFETENMICQHLLLSRVADLVDSGVIQTTQSEHFGKINAENLRKAHKKIETGRMIGKIVLENF